jgi:hypothetical protein
VVEILKKGQIHKTQTNPKQEIEKIWTKRKTQKWNEEEDKEYAEEDEEAERDDGEMREENNERGERHMFYKNQREDDLGSADRSR